MATYTATVRENLIGIYMGMFKTAPGADALSEMANMWTVGNMTQKQIAAELAKKAAFTAEYPELQLDTEFADEVVEWLASEATSAGKSWATNWIVGRLGAGASKSDVIVEAVLALRVATNEEDFGDAKANLNNKVEVGVYYAVTKDQKADSAEIIADVTSDADSIDEGKEVADGKADDAAGQTFSMTKGLDTLKGGAGNDKFIGSVDSGNAELQTASAIDTIDGGTGVDTLKISAATAMATANLPTLTNVEVVEISAANAINVNASTVTGLTNLNVIKAGAAQTVAVTAGSSTDISVAMQAVGATVAADGGKDVNVTLTDVAAADAVTIGGGATKAAGAVTVASTGKASVAGADATLNAVTVTGGTSISVTQTATSSSAAAASDKVGATITQGAITVTGNASTTEVTLVQSAAVAEVLAVDAVAAKAATQEITFTAAAKGDTVELDFGAGTLKFTANKDLTAAEVAAAFANLSKDSVQGSAAAANGIYTDATGGVSDGWTSGAAVAVSSTQSKVVFSNAAAAPAAITSAETGTVTATDGAVAGGTAAVTAKTGVLGVANGAVSITDANATIKTITVNGYATGSTTTTTSVLETLNLANAAGTASFVAADTAATLALTVEKLGKTGDGNEAVVTFTAAPTTLNVKSVGANWIDLTSAATETLNVSGTGALDLADIDLAALKSVSVTETAGLTLNAGVADTVETVNTTGTTGTVTISIQGNKASYSGGAGVDKVTVTNPGTAISKVINLGGGNDSIDLTAATPVNPSQIIEGGEGTDIIKLAAADAASLTAVTTFEPWINAFEKLEIGAIAAAATVNLDNLDDINYVIAAGNGNFAYVLDKMLNNATLELTGASTGTGTIEVKLKDATGTSDTVNIVTNAATTTDLGTAIVDGVETVAISVTNTGTAAAPSTNTLELDADAAKTITVTGAGKATLTLTAASTAVTLIDASAATGAMTITTLAGDLGATTVKGGTGADVLTASSANDVLEGGAGKDTLKVVSSVTNAASATTLTGGADTDSFDVSAFKAANPGSAVTITDFSKGETIKFVADANANFSSAKVSLISEATFTEYVTEAASQADIASGATHGVAWFQFNGNTFIVQDVSGDGAFTDGTDIIVKLTGLLDLSASSFNESGSGTLLYV